jgi:hypothetical protein
MCCPSYAWRLLDLDAQHGFHRTHDHLQKSGHTPMMRAYHVSGAQTELEIPDADQINFQNVHRLRKRNDGKPRNIIARFTHYKDTASVSSS